MRDAGQAALDTQVDAARVDLAPGHSAHDAHVPIAGSSLGTDQILVDTHSTSVGTSSCDGHLQSDIHVPRAVAPHNALLLILADSLDDLERVRVATGNRLRALTAVPQNKHDSAKGLAGLPEAKRLDELLAGITALEKQATLDLQRAMRTHPLGVWVKRTIGVGEKQAARLLAALGDPAGRPNPAKLWQYAGHGDPKRSRQSKDNVTYMETEDGKTVVVLPFSPTAKMRTWMVAESAVQAGVRKLDDCDDSDGYDLAHRKAITPLGQVYLDARAKWADRTDCPSCKDECSDGHKHAHALRVVGKAVLLDLWREARSLRSGQASHDLQSPLAAADSPPTKDRATPMPLPSAASTSTAEVVA